MNTLRFRVFAATLILAFSANANSQTAEPYKPTLYPVRTLMFAGDLLDPQPATQGDRKLWVQFEGQPAKDVFQMLKAPKVEVTLPNGAVGVEKRRQSLVCQGGRKTNQFRCVYQMDLNSGEITEAPFFNRDEPADWHAKVAKDPAQFDVYSGFKGDPLPPVFGQSKLAIYIEGGPSKAFFSAIGPDTKHPFSTPEEPLRIREKVDGGLECKTYPKSKTYYCAIGLDLKKIKPTYSTAGC